MNIVFVGLSGVPFKKRAVDLRLISFAKSFIDTGNSVTILNRVPIVRIKDKSDAGMISSNMKIAELFQLKREVINSIEYAVFFIFSFFAEYIWFFRNNKKEKIDIIQVYSGHYIDLIHYYLISRIIGAKVVYQYVEVRTAKSKSNLYHKINSYLVDSIGYKLFDGVISISDYITEHVENKSKKLPIIKVPPICDIENFNLILIQHIKPDIEYVLFCGSANYFEPIKLIIDSYKASQLTPDIKLYLVLSGSEDSLDRVRSLMTRSMYLFGGLPYDDLIKMYIGAKALLIPLRNSVEDVARFPNKICEYTASRGVIVTTGYGEINNYFRDNYNALVADDFTVASFTEKLNLIKKISDLELENIKTQSYKVCSDNFDITVYKNELHEFLSNLIRQY